MQARGLSSSEQPVGSVNPEVTNMQIEMRIRPPQLNGRGPTEERDERRTGYVYGGLTLVGIWLAVVFTSIFAPDMVTGSIQDHFPLALVVALLAGLAATRSVVRAFSHGLGGTSRWGVYALMVAASGWR